MISHHLPYQCPATLADGGPGTMLICYCLLVPVVLYVLIFLGIETWKLRK